MKIQRQFRQGDVLLHPVQALPANAVAVKGKGDIILAEGEATGHAHRVRKPGAKVKQFMAGTELYLEVVANVTVDHEEHSAVPLAPGLYHVRRQVEAWMDEVRQVAD